MKSPKYISSRLSKEEHKLFWFDNVWAEMREVTNKRRYRRHEQKKEVQKCISKY